MSIRSKIVLTVLCLTALLLSFPTMAEESGHQVDPSVAVIFTNDIHSNYDQDIGYDGLMLLKKELGQQYAHVILVDAGDAVQGRFPHHTGREPESMRYNNNCFAFVFSPTEGDPT